VAAAFSEPNTLNPLDFNLVRGRRVEVISVGQFSGAEGVEENVFRLWCVLETVGRRARECFQAGGCVVLDGDTGVGGVMSQGCAAERNSCRPVFMRVEGEADGDGGNDDADHECICCRRGAGADDVAVLRSCEVSPALAAAMQTLRRW